jgi:hypothetical protein
MKMPEPVAWIRGSGLEVLKPENGGVATVFASNGMSNYSQPLYDKQALIDLLEEAAQKCHAVADEYQKREGHQWRELKSDAEAGASECAEAIRKMKEKL